jgi:AraC family transcriptional regulator
MEEQNWVRPEPGKSEMDFSVRASSLGRGWGGLDATLFDTSGGLIEFPEASRFNVGMHIGVPVRATCRCDGPIHRRLQVPGDIDIVPVGYAAAWEDEGPTLYLSISLTPSIMRSAADAMHVDLETVSVAPQMQVRDEKIYHIALAIKAELESQDRHDRVYAEGLGLALAAHLLRCYGNGSPNGACQGLTRKQLQKAISYIREHLTKDLTLSELAVLTGISPSHFKVLFKRSTGVPVHKYIVRCRVEHAVNLITQGRRTLSDVALQSGFADQSHMSRCMRRVAGMTPATVMRNAS